MTVIRTFYKSLIFALIFLTLIVSFSMGYLYIQVMRNYDGRILPGIIVNDYNFSGLSKEQVKEYVKNQNRNLEQDVLITISYPDLDVATFSAQMLNAKYDDEELFNQTYAIGRNLSNIKEVVNAVNQVIFSKKIHLTVLPEYSTHPIELHLKNKQKQSYIKPQDALFNVVNNKVVAFKIDRPGSKLDISPAISMSRQYFQTDPTKKRKPLNIVVKNTIIQAKIPMSEANDLGIVEVIGRGVSNFAHSAPPRVFNIKLVSSRINGTLVPKDEVFSFNKAAGEISAKTGYQSGYAIISGATVLSDGGGVCQESSTIFRAVLNAGLPITQWKNHSYRVRYYENDSKPGFDATVYAPSVDFKFKNDTPAHILVQSSIEGTILTVTLYGKKDSRKVEISESRVWGIVPPPEPLYKDEPTLPKGTTKQIDYAAWGARAAFDYKVTRGNEILQDRTFTSVYRPWQAVFLVGTM